jgi:hypothetical protein
MCKIDIARYYYMATYSHGSRGALRVCSRGVLYEIITLHLWLQAMSVLHDTISAGDLACG